MAILASSVKRHGPVGGGVLVVGEDELEFGAMGGESRDVVSRDGCISRLGAGRLGAGDSWTCGFTGAAGGADVVGGVGATGGGVGAGEATVKCWTWASLQLSKTSLNLA